MQIRDPGGYGKSSKREQKSGQIRKGEKQVRCGYYLRLADGAAAAAEYGPWAWGRGLTAAADEPLRNGKGACCAAAAAEALYGFLTTDAL